MMNLENIMLSERSQAENATSDMILFIWNVWNRQIQSDSKQVVAREEGEWVLNGSKVSFQGDENVLWWTEVMIAHAQLCEYTKTIELYTSKD